ncbi:MAG TPA: hypothetical protein VNA28_05410 [Solirubrobacteraceae bacterium]|nr:hypothetical protein [Solirubrobacteraceae bacterium]
MRRAALLAALLGAVAYAAPAASQHPSSDDASGGATAPAGMTLAARISFDAMLPPRLDLVAGESVRWTNESVRMHTVTAEDGSFDSGRLASSEAYRRRFGTAGEARYFCRLHPSMRGLVAVHDLLLDNPGQAAAPNRPFPLSGRAALPAGTPVSIEADSGTGFAPIASSTIGEDGRFAARIVPAASTTLRAVAGAATSSSVKLLVLDHRISLTARTTMLGRVRLRANVTPPARGGRVVLQLFLPERFGWWPVRTAVLDKRSGATFTLRTRLRRARVRYTLADGATALATSRILRIGRVRAPARHDD